MGFFDFLFKKNNLKPMKSSEKITLTSNTAPTNQFDFLRESSKSTNNHWTIYWSDYNNEQDIGGYRESGNGKIILYNGIEKKIAFQTELQRPNSGNVANNGTFSIEDWHFGGGMVGTFYVFSNNGSILLKHKFEANIVSSGISDDGQYAICQTAFSQTHDSSMLTLFDIINNKIIFSIKSKIEFGYKYLFDVSSKHISIVINGIGTVDCDFNGNIIDIQEYYEKCLDSDRCQTAINAAELLLKQNNNKDIIQKIINSLSFLSSDKYISNNNKAKILKLQAESFELLMNYNEALKLYREALTLNPNIGVKKKIATLEKLLA